MIAARIYCRFGTGFLADCEPVNTIGEHPMGAFHLYVCECFGFGTRLVPASEHKCKAPFGRVQFICA